MVLAIAKLQYKIRYLPFRKSISLSTESKFIKKNLQSELKKWKGSDVKIESIAIKRKENKIKNVETQTRY